MFYYYLIILIMQDFVCLEYGVILYYILNFAFQIKLWEVYNNHSIIRTYEGHKLPIKCDF